MSSSSALVVGASGAIGYALVNELAADDRFDKVFAVSRQDLSHGNSKVTSFVVGEYSDQSIEALCRRLKAEGIKLARVIIATGILHQPGKAKMPEKRLEDINTDDLQAYFLINSILPGLWLKHLASVMARDGAHIVCVSARVGSISDNRLGGWYGYRASKAALNMLIKTAQVEYQRRSPNTVLVAYHPGTVDSNLSKPFQKNLPEGQLIAPQTSAKSLLSQLDNLSTENAPHYVDWKGQHINW